MLAVSLGLLDPLDPSLVMESSAYAIDSSLSIMLGKWK